jgi:hypothetical protein
LFFPIESKQLKEVARQRKSHFSERNYHTGFLLYRGCSDIRHATRIDKPKAILTIMNIARKTVHGAPPGELHTERGDLSSFIIACYPHPSLPRDEGSCNAKISEGSDDDLLKSTDIPSDIASDWIEIKERVSNDLPGTVIRRITAPFNLKKSNALLVK